MAQGGSFGRAAHQRDAVAFGWIDTRLTQPIAGEPARIEVGERAVQVGVQPQMLEMMRMATPLGRPGTPEEAAGAVYLLCTPESDYISGEVILVGGGLRV